MLNVGDLVKHHPSGSSSEAIVNIYEDWGHTPEFQAGIVIRKKDTFAQVLAAKPGAKPRWYQFDELEVISESR